MFLIFFLVNPLHTTNIFTIHALTQMHLSQNNVLVFAFWHSIIYLRTDLCVGFCYHSAYICTSTISNFTVLKPFYMYRHILVLLSSIILIQYKKRIPILAIPNALRFSRKIYPKDQPEKPGTPNRKSCGALVGRKSLALEGRWIPGKEVFPKCCFIVFMFFSYGFSYFDVLLVFV